MATIIPRDFISFFSVRCGRCIVYPHPVPTPIPTHLFIYLLISTVECV